MTESSRSRRSLAGLLTLTLAGASGSALVGAMPAAADETDGLIISEYVEGSSFNKALEITNLADSAAPLEGVTVDIYFNGNTESSLSLDLEGTLESGSSHVIAHSQANAEILAAADQTNGAGWFNGDDAIVLRDANGVVDSFGQVGTDPGSSWGSGVTSTANQTLRRAADVCAGDTDIADEFDPADQWEGFETDVADGLGEHTSDCTDGGTDPEPAAPVINEFSASTTGADVEFFEVFGQADTDYSDLSILQVEGDSSSSAQGSVITSDAVGTTDADGLWSTDLASNRLQNGTLTLLLVDGYDGTDVIDSDGDGQLDESVAFEVVDSIAVNDGDDGDLTYGSTTLTDGYDGFDFAPGGASRIPDGQDTDSASDWVRNDFNLAGIEDGVTGTAGQALNTPGELNALIEGEDPGEGASCEEGATVIGAIQGSGDTSPLEGDQVCVEGVVVGDFQEGGIDGFYVQDEGDGDSATSDGLFIYAPGGTEVAEGEAIQVAGEVSEYQGMTQVTADGIEILEGEASLPEATELTLPMTEEELEQHEGMRVSFPQDLSIAEFYNYGRYGEVVLSAGRQFQPTAIYEPGSTEAEQLLQENLSSRITLDDGRTSQNPDPAIHPNGEEFTLENSFRGGDLVTNATGVLDWRFDLWRIQPTEGADYTSTNERPEAPSVEGDLTVASFNVLNYFTTLGSRGADTAEEFDRQEAKIVSAIAEMDADVVGLIEIENNNDEALATLTQALNDYLGQDQYDYVATGTIGTDEITTAFIYQPEEATPQGDFATLTSADDDRFLDEKNRPTLAQTFVDNGSQEAVTVAVNHLKSKGSSCEDVGDPEDPDNQGNCNQVRTDAALAMADWLAGDPTGTGVEDNLIIGDLNAYDKEDPITALREAGYTDLLLRDQGERAYSYVFDGQLGYLDYALASESLAPSVTDTVAWAINADEPSLIDYDMTFKADAQDALFAEDPYRSSDHDPILVGLALEPADETAPTLELSVSPEEIWPPNKKMVSVEVTTSASDDSGEVSVELVSAEVTSGKGRLEQQSSTAFEAQAVRGSAYTFTYEATDAAGNSTTESITVEVSGPGNGNGGGDDDDDDGPGNGNGNGWGRFVVGLLKSLVGLVFGWW